MSVTRDRVGYSPVRHLASAAFPYFLADKYMLALTGYFDETGSDADPNSKYCGMAGIVSEVSLWEDFEVSWRKRLDADGLSHMHMKDFAHCRGEFREGWQENEYRRKELLSDLWDIIEWLNPLFVGSVVPMEFYRNLMEKPHRDFWYDAYFMSYTDCVFLVCDFVSKIKKDMNPLSVAMVFDDKKGLKGIAHSFHEKIVAYDNNHLRIQPPVFRDMRYFSPLQAADMVAYEVYKECDRRVNGRESPRYGYKRIDRMVRAKCGVEQFRFYTAQDIIKFNETTQMLLNGQWPNNGNRNEPEE